MHNPHHVIQYAPPSHNPAPYRGTSLTRKRTPLGLYRRPMPRFLGRSYGGGQFFLGEVPLHSFGVQRLLANTITHLDYMYRSERTAEREGLITCEDSRCPLLDHGR